MLELARAGDRYELRFAGTQAPGRYIVRGPRPDDPPQYFVVRSPGEESDLIFSVEEASFYGGAWHVRGVLSGALLLRVTLPGSLAIHKGKLMALRYDASRFRLLKK